jgi:hypothetical protein
MSMFSSISRGIQLHIANTTQNCHNEHTSYKIIHEKAMAAAECDKVAKTIKIRKGLFLCILRTNSMFTYNIKAETN